MSGSIVGHDVAGFIRRNEQMRRNHAALLGLARLHVPDASLHVRAITEKAAETLAVERVSVWWLQDGGEAIVCEHLYHLSRRSLEVGARLESRDLPIYFDALRTCRAIVAHDVERDPRMAEFRRGYCDVHRITSMLDVPIWGDGALAGVLCFEHVGPRRRWSLEDEEFARAIADLIALARETGARSRVEQRYRMVASATGEVVWEWDLATDRIEWSDTLQTVFGYPAGMDSGSGAFWISKVHPADRARVSQHIAEVIATGQPAYRDEYRFIRGDDTVVTVADRGFVTRDENGKAVRMTGAMQDITARRSLEAKLVAAERLASLGTLAAGVAHEINNPLAYVIGNLEFALGELEASAGDPEVAAALAEARSGAMRVAAIVRDMKTFSRPESATPEAVDIGQVVESALNMARNDIRLRAQLVRDIAPTPPVAAIEARLGQVILNLLLNAAQAIPPGDEAAHEIRVATGVDAESRVFIEVSDTGPGIAPEMLPRIFDPFFTTKQHGGGTGLGLSICHSIVTSMGGEIGVEASTAGTTFRVSLPVAAAS